MCNDCKCTQNAAPCTELCSCYDNPVGKCCNARGSSASEPLDRFLGAALGGGDGSTFNHCALHFLGRRDVSQYVTANRIIESYLGKNIPDHIAYGFHADKTPAGSSDLFSDTPQTYVKFAEEEFRQWQLDFCGLQSGTVTGVTKREESKALLIRGAMADGETFFGWFYSFCRDEWVEFKDYYHCFRCGACRGINTWHCRGSRKGTDGPRCDHCVEGLLNHCSNCGGVSIYYHEDKQALAAGRAE